MSTIYFHNVNGEARVSGAERHLLGRYCCDALLFSLGDMSTWRKEPPWILKHIPKGCYLHDLHADGRLTKDSIETWLNVGSMTSGSEGGLMLNGKLVSLFQLQLNTAYVMGGSALRLAARLHGQCEIHCYVEGVNRKWFAGMIEESLQSRIFRADVGWESVCKLLRKESKTPVVCSYSVCEQFPNSGVLDDWDDNEDGEKWYALSKAKQWELAVDAIRKEHGLEIKPEEWDDFHFGEKRITGFDFYAAECTQAKEGVAA